MDCFTELPQSPSCLYSKEMNEDVSVWILLFGVPAEGEMWAAGVIAKVLWSLRANQTRPPPQLLTFPINTGSRLSLSLSLHLASLRRLAPQPDCLPYSVDTGRLLRQSLASLTPALPSSAQQRGVHVPSHMHALRLSQSFPCRGSRCTHFDTFWHVFLLLLWIKI